MTARALVEGIRRYLTSLERRPGELYCSKHGIEHTGTMAYAAMLEAERLEPGASAGDLALASRVAARVVSRVAEDPAESYGAWIVLPGSRDPNNHANNAIDCGCAIDALATLGRRHGGALEGDLRRRVEEAVRQVCDTYIVPHAMPKEIPAQRLWSLAGLGSAYRWLGVPTWRAAGLAALERTFAQQHADGSFPYTPLHSPHSHAGSSDASAFYHSRPVLFAVHALESFGVDVPSSPFAERLRAACEFLLALRRADGTKTTFVEAKPWYWGSSYEVAGFPFDVAALAACGRVFGERRYLGAARAMLEILTRHVEPDGGITSHRGPGWNFQCRAFWNAHAAWIAREAKTLDGAEDAEAGASLDGNAELRWFPDAGFGRFADPRIVVLFRGATPPRNLLHGSPFGGGGLLHAASRRDPARELVGKVASDDPPAGEWSVVPRRGNSAWTRWRSAWRENREALRFSLWVARVRWRSGDHAGAVRWLLGQWIRGTFGAARAGYSSAFATQCRAEAAANTVAFRGTVADVFGNPLTGVETIRRYAFEAGVVRAGDALATDVDLTQCRYRVPRGATDVSVDGPVPQTRAGVMTLGPLRAGSLVAVRYRIEAP